MKIVKELSFENFANYRGEIAVENHNMIVQKGHGTVKLTDLTNAGKRGEVVPTISICYKDRDNSYLFLELLENHGYNLRVIYDNILGDTNLPEYYGIQIGNNEILETYLSVEKGVRVKSPFIESKFKNVVPKVSDKIEVGAIMSESWGYEQTNVDFYCVVQVKGNFVTLLPMSSEVSQQEVSFMSNKVKAGEINFLGTEIRKKYDSKNSGFSIKHGWCSLWSGEPETESHYA
jgi:hypothetical protein